MRDYQFIRSRQALATDELVERKYLLQRFFQSKSDHGDPFNSHYFFFDESNSKVDPVRKFIMRQFPAWVTYSAKEKLARSKEYSDGKPPYQVSAFVDRLVRFIIAVAGGLFLIVPMLIMTLGGQSEKKSLITVTVSVFLFILILAFGIRVSNVETLVATATYAAVLVVFIGTSSGTLSPSPLQLAPGVRNGTA